MGDRDPPRPAAGPGDRRSRRLQADQRRARSRRRRPPAAPGVDDHRRRTCDARDRAFRVGGDEFAIILPGTDAEAHGSWSGGCWRPASTARGRPRPDRRLVLGRDQPALAGAARDRDALYSQAEAALLLEQAPRPDVRHRLRPRAHDAPTAERPPAELSALVARVAATGAIRAVFQPIYDLSTGAPRGFEGLVRPLPDSGFADPGTMFAAAEATGRTVELDIACMNMVMETAARLRLPGILTVNLSPRTLEMDDFSIHALLRMIVRHGLDPRHVVLELTEREAVEDIGRLRRAVEACRVAGIRLAADDVGAGNAGLRLLSQLRFDIVKIDLSLVQGGAAPRRRRSRSSGPCATWPTAGARWSSPRGSRRPPSSTSSARSGSAPARATCSAGRPTGRRPKRSTSRSLSRSTEWLIERLRARAGMTGRSARPAPTVGAVDASRIPARLPPRCRYRCGRPTWRPDWAGSNTGARRKVAIVDDVGWPARARPDRSVVRPTYPSSTFSCSLPGLGGLLGLITGSRRDRGTRRDERR